MTFPAGSFFEVSVASDAAGREILDRLGAVNALNDPGFFDPLDGGGWLNSVSSLCMSWVVDWRTTKTETVISKNDRMVDMSAPKSSMRCAATRVNFSGP